MFPSANQSASSMLDPFFYADTLWLAELDRAA
jgi:hypothetical protein